MTFNELYRNAQHRHSHQYRFQPSDLRDWLNTLTRLGWIERHGNHYQLTAEGLEIAHALDPTTPEVHA